MNNLASYFDGSIVIRQRVLTRYRAPLFDLIADRCAGPVVVVAGDPLAGEGISTTDTLNSAQLRKVMNMNYGSGVAWIYWQRGLTGILSDVKPDALITEANPRFVDNGAAIRNMHKRSAPVLGWGLGTTNFFGHGWTSVRRWIRRRTIDRFDGILAYSSKAADQYVQELSVAPERVAIAYNATKVRPQTPAPERKPSFAGRMKLLFIGRLVEHKRVDLLFDAISKRRHLRESVCVWIVGDGPDRARLERIAEERDLDVQFYGTQSGDALREIGLRADVFVLPSLGGLAIQEAMSFGLPVIVSEADGTEHDLVRDNGWIFKPGNADDLARVIESAVGDAALTRTKGLESFRIVAEEINLELTADRFVDFVNRIKQLGLR